MDAITEIKETTAGGGPDNIPAGAGARRSGTFKEGEAQGSFSGRVSPDLSQAFGNAVCSVNCD